MSEWIVNLEGVHFTYPGTGKEVLKELTLRVPPGKKCVLLGHNGCGKSTLFLHVNGILRPQKGKVFWRGEEVQDHHLALAHVRHKVGLVFQDPEQQIVASTVAEDISYGLCNLKLPMEQIKERVNQILERFHLTEWANRPIHHLSLGQKKRVALAGVMVLEPELLLLDEPTAYLDRYHTEKLLEELDRIHASGTTILMATHDLDVAFAWGEWIFVMDQGCLVMEGTPEEIFRQREKMMDLRLGIPLLLDVWQLLLETVGQGKEWQREGIPRSVNELRRRLYSLGSHLENECVPNK